MKKYGVILLFMIWFSLTVQAQTVAVSPAVDPLLKGQDLLRQLAQALDDASVVNSWTSQQQSQWFAALHGKKNASGLAESTDDLTGYIKPTSFKEGFSLSNLRSLISEAKNYGDVANILRTLEGGIKVEAYTNDWVSKEDSWLSELKFVK